MAFGVPAWVGKAAAKAQSRPPQKVARRAAPRADSGPSESRVAANTAPAQRRAPQAPKRVVRRAAPLVSGASMDYATAHPRQNVVGPSQPSMDQLTAQRAALARTLLSTRKSATTTGPPLGTANVAGPVGATLSGLHFHIPHAASAPALAILEQTTRPLHGIVAAERTFLKGKSPAAVVKAGAQGLANKRMDTTSDLLKDVGIKGTAGRVLGTIGDVVGDPTTYATFGAGGLAKGAVKVAAEDLGKGAAKSAVRHAAAEAGGRGVQAGMRFHVPFTNWTAHPKVTVPGTPKVEKATRVVRKKIREDTPGVSRVIQGAGKDLNPNFRPKELTPVEHQGVRQAWFNLRGRQAAATKHWAHRVRAYAKAVKTPAEHQQVFDALEQQGRAYDVGASIKAVGRQQRKLVKKGKKPLASPVVKPEPNGIAGLPQHLQEPARSLQADLAAMGSAEHQRNLLGALRSHYVPHVPPDKLEPVTAGEPPLASRIVSGALDASHARKDTRLHAVKREQGLVSSDLPAVLGHRAGQHVSSINISRFWEDVANKAGRPLTGDTVVNLGGGDVVYKLEPTGLTPLKTARKVKLGSIQNALKDTSGKFYVINAHAVEHAKGLLTQTGRAKTGAGSAFNRIQGRLKFLQTAPNPGYHINNLMGDTLMGRQGEATTRDMIDAARIGRLRVKQAKFERSPEAVSGGKAPTSDASFQTPSGPVRYTDAIKMMEEHGVTDTGFQAADLKTLLKKGGGQGKLGRLSQARENLPRGASFIGALKRGKTPEEAAAHAREFHFDYGDLTPFESGIARKAIPFWTFQARNTKLQAKQLVKRPGNFATYEKVRENTAKQAGLSIDEFDKLLNTYQLRGVPFVGPGGTNIYPKVPMTQGLSQVTLSPKAQIQNLVNAGSVVAKVPIELAQNRNFFFNENIVTDKRPRVPAPALATATSQQRAVIGTLSKALGLKDIQKIRDPRSGKMVWGWDPRLDFLAQQLPQTNLSTQLSLPSANRHGVDKALGAINYVTGIKVGRRDVPAVQLTRLYDQGHKLTLQKNDLVQRGLDRMKNDPTQATPAYRKILDQQKALSKQITDAKKARGDVVKPKLKRVKRTGGGGGGGGFGLDGGSGGFGLP